MITVMSRMNKEYTVLGTSLFLILITISLGLIVWIYTLCKDPSDTGGNLARAADENEKSVIIAAFSLAAVVCAAGFLHMLLEKHHFRRLFGYSVRKSSPRRSPARKSSPKRKLGTLRPRK